MYQETVLLQYRVSVPNVLVGYNDQDHPSGPTCVSHLPASTRNADRPAPVADVAELLSPRGSIRRLLYQDLSSKPTRSGADHCE